jgi:ABC-2 type transport system ATP-binding protein
VAEGTTVLLTTQVLEEADQLADRVAVVDQGRVIAEDSPLGLKASLRGDWIDVVVRDAAELSRAAAVLGDGAEVDVEARRVSAPVRDRMAALAAVVRELGEDAEDVTLRRPTLAEVFLALTATPSPAVSSSEVRA